MCACVYVCMCVGDLDAVSIGDCEVLPQMRPFLRHLFSISISMSSSSIRIRIRIRIRNIDTKTNTDTLTLLLIP